MKYLKFRAWDKTVQKMLFFDGIFNKKPYAEMSTFPQYESSPKFHELELMQYIGLRDKDNKDIYEEDIVRVQANYSGDHYYRECIAIVRYEENEFTLYNPLDKDGIVWQDFAWNSLEIIGNIYENPELLGDK